MESKVSRYQSKINRLLEKLLESKCEIEIEGHLNKLLVTFFQQEAKEVESALIALPIFAEWLRRAVRTWSAARVTPPTGVASFTMNLAALLSKNEETFCSLNNNNFFIKLVNVLKARQNGVALSVKLSYIKLLSSFLEHKSGMELMIACNFWENVFQFSLTDQDEDLRKGSTMFMSKLLESTIDCDEDFCDEIVKRIMLPLGENVYRSIKASADLADDSDEVASKHLKPTLKLMGDILKYFLEAMLFGQEDYRIALLFLKNFLQEERISDFMMMAQLKCLVFDVSKIMFIMRFLELYVKFVTNSVSTDSLDATVCGVKRDFILNVSKCNHQDSIDFCDFGQFYWRLIETKIPMTRISKTECFPLSNQFLILMLMPQCCVTLKYCRSMQDLEETLLNDEFRNIFVQKLFKITCQDMIRLCYTWRDCLIDRSDLFKIGTHSMNLFKHHRQYYSREQAVILFQMLIYNLKDMIDSIKESPAKLDIFLAETDYLYLIFEILNSILGEFEITWKDSFETIDMMSVAFDFLTLPNWSERIVVQLLKLINVATAKNMAPNLALLVDSTANSTVGLLGPVLYTRLLDEVVEVKEAALEVICTMSKMSNTKVESTMMILPILAQWVKYAVTVWTVKGVTPTAEIAAFAMNAASLLSKDEKRFCDLNCNNFFIKLVNIVQARQAEADQAVKLAYVKWLASLLEHQSGVELMMVCNFWEDVLQLSLTAKDVRVKKESIRFMSKLLDKTIDPDERFAKNVITRMMAPLSEAVQSDDHFAPTLKLIGDILDYFLEEILFGEKSFRVVFVFLENFQMEENIAKYKVASQSKSLAYDLGKIMFVMQFLELYYNVIGNKLSGDTIDTSITKMKINFISKVCKSDDIAVAMKFCEFSHVYWSLIESKIPLKKNTKKSNPLPNQLIILELIPIFCIVKSFSITRSEMRMLMQNEFRDYFLEKLQRMSCHDVYRACYIWRDYYLARPDLLKICSCCVHWFKKSRKYYSREGGVVIFQALIYSLKDFIHSIKEQPQRLEGALDDLEYFWQLFDILAVFIEDFRITWRDGFEAADVVTECFEFLTLATWPDRIVVEALKLMNVATAKYMSPNLALLVDTTTDSIVALLGPLLYAKLSGQTPLVKKAALEVIRTMAHMSNCKFPSLQKVLMDSELPTLVVKMSTCDGESFVRATAIKCLQEMIQVEEIWNNALKSEDLSQKMRDILFNETEGIVRVEAATFMCVAYENQQFPKDALEGVYETMIYSSTTDLHWEVKVRALGFWDQVIKNHLQNQGMIDGSFPNVTFSKEHRKIVTLTDSEIRKRLLKVLGQLSSIGCLGVLMSAIKDDCDMEVSKTAVKITQRLVELFKNYNVRSDCSTPTSPLPTENGMSATASVSSGISADDTMVDSPVSSHPDLNEEIIEQIVNSKDVCLLKNVYAPSDYGSVNNYDIQVRKIVTPNEFLQFTQQDLNSIIADKKNWLNGIEDLGSLLDDMLKTYDDDVNKMDCY